MIAMLLCSTHNLKSTRNALYDISLKNLSKGKTYFKSFGDMEDIGFGWDTFIRAHEREWKKSDSSSIFKKHICNHTKFVY
mmetsp:Transcript_13798/g.16752  ORF Transcript_13798/g.16752 Transcript_13798/m.16752 type:complete len:80 (+) Transcript_13798:94-333(+)